MTVDPQLSADGRRWVDDPKGASVLPAGDSGITVRQRQFGGWSRLVFDLPDADGTDERRVDIYLPAKE